MKKATKRSVVMACIFLILSTINLIMEYKKSNPSGLVLKWIMLAAFSMFAVVAFIRYDKQKRQQMDDPK